MARETAVKFSRHKGNGLLISASIFFLFFSKAG